ncbi:MAG: hypothetical protein JWO00_625 [Candidatus Parcubacteria bacterium]|nr:hypothetical protein [Candidatus Parcubacteria bacterium]
MATVTETEIQKVNELREEKRKRAELAMKRNKARDTSITATMIMINVACAFFLSMLLSCVFLAIYALISPYSVTFTSCFISLGLGLGFGIIIWTSILFKTKVFDYFFINVKQNWVVVLGNQLVKDDIPNDPDERIKMFERGALREVGQGIRGKWPWEVPVESVNLRSEVIIGPAKDKNLLVCVTKDEVQLSINWQVVMTPLVGFAVNLIRRNQAAIEAYFKGIFDQKIIAWIKLHKEEEVFNQLNDLKKMFEDTLGGGSVASIEEMDWGTFTNDPQLINVNRNERFQKAAEGTQVGIKMAGEVARINKLFEKSNNKPDPDMVLATAASLVGNNIEGLFLIPGAGKGLAGVASQMGAKLPDKKQKDQNQKGGKKHE